MFFAKATYAELRQGYTNRNGFIFTTLTDPANVHDAIVVHVLQSAGCITPQLPHSSRSFAEHLALIQSEGLEKAIVISDEIGWLSQCPSLQFLWVIPSDSAADGFDFSPLYHMPCVKWLRCQTAYGIAGKLHGEIDYGKVPGLRCLYVSHTKYEYGFANAQDLQSLNLCAYQGNDLADVIGGESLDWLSLTQGKIHSLNGLHKAKSLKSLSLCYQRNLTDISALVNVKSTLFQLCLDQCSHITDFSALSALSALEYLELQGNSILPNLSFLCNMPNLKVLNLGMDVADGDLRLCMNVPYVTCKNRRHFNLRDAELPKRLCSVQDDHGVELWRRC